MLGRAFLVKPSSNRPFIPGAEQDDCYRSGVGQILYLSTPTSFLALRGLSLRTNTREPNRLRRASLDGR